MDKKKVIYIGLLLILTVIISITYFSYAFFTSKYEQRGKLNIVTGTLDYKIESSDLTNNSITLEVNKSKQIEIEITSLNNIDSKYELYYQTTDSNIVVGYGSSNDTPTGTILANGKKTVKVAIKNKSNSQVTITFGVEGGFSSNELVLVDGNSITEIIDSICDYATGYVWNFPYDPDGDGQGQAQEFSTPCDGNYKIELWGAQGSGINSSYPGGNGGYTSGNILLDSNIILYIYVGQYSGNAAYKTTVFNGGGYGSYASNNDVNKTQIQYSGGGSTDIRIVAGEWNNFESLKSRIMVAGAGGGGGYVTGQSLGGAGGSSGGLTGYDGVNYATNYGYAQKYVGYGALQTNGGSSIDGSVVTVTGRFGYGGTGGGGSGYYGGGGATRGHGASGGGSSFISGYTGCNAIDKSSTSTSIIHTGQANHYSGYVFINGAMIDGKGCNWSTGSAKNCGVNQPQPDGTMATGHTGHGYARITYLGE